MRKKHWILVGAAAMLCVVLLTCAVVGLLIWRERSMPVYSMAQEPLPDGQGVMETLTLDGARYVHSLSEFALEPIRRGSQVGKTADGMRVHVPAGGNADGDYLILTGFMFPDVVYRRADAPVFDPQEVGISELRMMVNDGRFSRQQTSQDPALIAEVLARLDEPGALTAATETFDSYRLELFSPQAPGVYYFVYVMVAPDGRVFLAERSSPEEWFVAGESLTQWVREAMGQPAE
ncbi:MAG: hypothetical protein GX552_07885 [Chloroflexi bacterium]|nr:hypothetical protein [Chloroflexota bacterium]